MPPNVSSRVNGPRTTAVAFLATVSNDHDKPSGNDGSLSTTKTGIESGSAAPVLSHHSFPGVHPVTLSIRGSRVVHQAMLSFIAEKLCSRDIQ